MQIIKNVANISINLELEVDTLTLKNHRLFENVQHIVINN
jgi:hypothetical protein